MNKGKKGKNFEEQFKDSVKKDGLFIYRLRDNPMSYIKIDTIYTHDNICDFFVYDYPNLFALELKHTTYTSIGFQRTKEDNEAMIKYHQIKHLLDISEYDGIKAGLILSFENEKANKEVTFYISIENFLNFISNTTKKYINILDVVDYNGIKINQVKLRTNYHYNVKDLLEKIK